MNGYQYNELCHPAEEPRVIKLNDLSNQTPRTLLYGYTPSCPHHFTWHLYLNNKQQFVLIIYESGYPTYVEKPECVYRYDEELPIFEMLNNLPREIYPKRLYPESCDYEFMKMLQYMGAELSLTTFDPKRFDKVRDLIYHGSIDINDRT